MPKFRIEFLESTALPPIYVEMENLETAKAEAKRAAKEAMLDGIVGGSDPTFWMTKIYDEAGYLVATIEFRDLVSGRQRPGSRGRGRRAWRNALRLRSDLAAGETARIDIRAASARRAGLVAFVGFGGFLDLAPIVAVSPHQLPCLRGR